MTFTALLALLKFRGVTVSVLPGGKLRLAGPREKITDNLRMTVFWHKDALARLFAPQPGRRVVDEDGNVLREFDPGPDYAVLREESENRPGTTVRLQALFAHKDGRTPEWKTFASLTCPVAPEEPDHALRPGAGDQEVDARRPEPAHPGG